MNCDLCYWDRVFAMTLFEIKLLKYLEVLSKDVHYDIYII